MTLLIYTLQVVLGTILWKRFKFSLKDSFIFSIFVLPTIILVSVKLFDFIFGAKKVETEENIKCTENNGNGCFMDSCGHNCGCEGLREFGETLKSK